MKVTAPRRSPAMLAGWLFADLLLMLFLVAFAGQESPKGPGPGKSPTPSPSASPSTRRLISKEFCDLVIPVGSGDLGSLPRKVEDALARKTPSAIVDAQVSEGSRDSCLRKLASGPGSKVGVFIAYGASSNPQDSGSGYTVGQRAATTITKKDARFANASALWGWTGKHGGDHVELIVFFYGS